MKTKLVIIIVCAILFLAAFNIHNIYAFCWKAEHATVLLNNCQVDCELKGTISVIPFDGRYRLITEGQEVIFSMDSIKLITVPAQGGLSAANRTKEI
jgi:hypothetical protein